MAYYRVANLLVEMTPHGRTARVCEPYRTEASGTADIQISTAPETVRRRLQNCNPDYGEYLVSGEQFYQQLVRFHGMMLHASCVAVDDRAYLFSGDCGAGKSTHTLLWLDLLPDRAFILNDDKPAIRVEDGRCFVYGTPWSGKHGINRNLRVPLGGICFIRQAEKNAIRRMQALECVPQLLRQTVWKPSAQDMGCLLETLDQVISVCGVYELFCNMDVSAARLSYETMAGGKE